MQEFERDFPNWKSQVESSNYYTSRKGDFGGGAQFTVLMRPGMDFVVKIPKNERWLNGYKLVERLAPECAIPFVLTSGITLKIDGRKHQQNEIIVQEKANNALGEISNAFMKKRFGDASAIALGVAENDRLIFSNGIFVPDPNFDNFGIDNSGKVKCFDFGSARTDFEDDLEYTNLAFQRGISHYAIFLTLRALEKKIPPTETSVLPSNIYAHAIDIPAEIHKEAQMLESLIFKTEPTTKYNADVSLYFAKLGDQEFKKYSPIGSPYDLNEEFIRDYPRAFQRFLS